MTESIRNRMQACDKSKSTNGERCNMKIGAIAVIVGILIGAFPMFGLLGAVYVRGFEPHRNALECAILALIGVMLICTGLVLNRLERSQRQSD